MLARVSGSCSGSAAWAGVVVLKAEGFAGGSRTLAWCARYGLTCTFGALIGGCGHLGERSQRKQRSSGEGDKLFHVVEVFRMKGEGYDRS